MTSCQLPVPGVSTRHCGHVIAADAGAGVAALRRLPMLEVPAALLVDELSKYGGYTRRVALFPEHFARELHSNAFVVRREKVSLKPIAVKKRMAGRRRTATTVSSPVARPDADSVTGLPARRTALADAAIVPSSKPAATSSLADVLAY